jgi:hypothetical protein
MGVKPVFMVTPIVNLKEPHDEFTDNDHNNRAVVLVNSSVESTVEMSGTRQTYAVVNFLNES